MGNQEAAEKEQTISANYFSPRKAAWASPEGLGWDPPHPKQGVLADWVDHFATDRWSLGGELNHSGLPLATGQRLLQTAKQHSG